MELPRSTYYDQLEKGTLITADNLQRVAANLGINRAELLTRYRLIDPAEVVSLAEDIGGPTLLQESSPMTGVIIPSAKTRPKKRAKTDKLEPASGRAAPVALLSAEYDPPGLLALAKRRELALEIAHQLG